jgi:uroporphyrinogen-III synthase
LHAAGIAAIALPLFAVTPIRWSPPPPSRYDALLITSANAIRHGGEGLSTLRGLPVVAVGPTSAAAARAAGFQIDVVGSGDAQAAVAEARAAGFASLLHLGGRERIAVPGVEAMTVYASDALTIDPAVTGHFVDRTILLHSVRAARRVATLVDRDDRDRARIAIAAFSEAVAAAAGTGWRLVAIAAQPTEAALIAAATRD